MQAPTVSGVPVDGQTLTASTGTWAGTGPFTYTYQWVHCSLLTAECSDIEDATESSYTARPLDVGDAIEVIVTATGSVGRASATSPQTSAVGALLPANTELPSISGILQDGQLLSVVAGVWSGTEPISYSYQWEQCNGSGKECEELSGATGATLGLVSSLVGDTVRVIVTASNSGGSTSATSAATSVIAALLPGNTELPSIGGLLQDGQTLTAATGSWSGSTPIAYSYQWEQCNGSGKECEELSGATGATLGLVSSLVGDTVRVIVTASNSGGSTSATSAATSVIAALLPGNTELPSIGGLLQDGQTLTAATGSWSGSTPIAYSYQWEQCNGSGKECEELSGATGATLGLVSSLVGDTVRVIVTASNSGGSTSATSAATSVIATLLPGNTELPSIGGLLQDGQTLTAATGSWSGSTPIAYAYQWQKCNGEGKDCESISKATTETLSLVESLLGKTIRVVVTATNSGGSTPATSAASTPVLAILPVNTEVPKITGVLKVGDVLTTSKGEWSGPPAKQVTYSYQWQTCGALGNEKNAPTSSQRRRNQNSRWNCSTWA